MKTMTIAAILVATWLWCMCVDSEAATYIVDQTGSGDFITVQGAVDSAANGDTLLIKAGNYVENVLCSGKCLTYIGEGPGATVVAGSEAAPTIVIQGMPWPIAESVFADLSVLPHVGDGRAVTWDGYRATFRGCETSGELRGGSSSSSYATTTITDCLVSEVNVWGGYYGTSVIANSHIGSAGFTGKYIWDWGTSWCEGHSLETSSSVFGDMTLSCDSGIESSFDVIGTLSGSNGCSCRATGSTFETIDLGRGDLELLDCVVAGPVEVHGYAGISDNATWEVDIEGTLVQGDLVLDYGAYSDQIIFTMELAHNTVVGDLTTLFSFSGSPTYVDQYDVRSNIVSGHTALDGAFSWAANTTVSHNDFVGGFTPSGVAGSIYANVSVPALFCDANTADYQLQVCSPCVGAAHDGGDIGAFGVGCGCATPVEGLSWGSIKALYRQPSN